MVSFHGAPVEQLCRHNQKIRVCDINDGGISNVYVMWSVLHRWYTLDSRPGKKKKERGKIQVSIQFMRNNMTASMFDLSMRDKPRSPFSKLKDKVKGRKHDSDASSAILPRSAQCDAESQLPRHGSNQKPQHTTAALESKPKRSLLPGTQKLSAAHSMSDLVGTNFRPKTDSVNSMEESGETGARSAYILIPFRTWDVQKNVQMPATVSPGCCVLLKNAFQTDTLPF